MASEVAKLKPLQVPGEVIESESDAKYEVYKADGLYEYSLQANGKPNKARARITYNHGDVYDGDLKRGKYNGSGSYQWKDGGFYEGAFSGGKLEGAGKYSASNGDIYEGSFKNNKYDGEGKYTWEDGSSFEGVFKDSQMMSGKYTDANGNVYDCKFTYKHNGERKSGSIRLVRFAQPKKASERKHEEKKTATKAGEDKADKSGLLSKDKNLISVIRHSQWKAKFNNLYNGTLGKSTRNEKELMTMLNKFTDSNAAQMQRIFKASKLYDATKGDEYVNSLVSDLVVRSSEYSKAAKSPARAKQSSAEATSGAVR